MLVLAPVGRDSELLVELARRAGLNAISCEDIEQLCEQIRLGAGAVFLTEEALYLRDSHEISKTVRTQEPWSDLPFVVLVSRGDVNERVAKTGKLLEPLGNVTVIERPVRPATIMTALHAALRNRGKQYEVKRSLDELRSSYSRLGLTLKAAHAGAWEWDAATDSVLWSPEFYDVFGIDPERQPDNGLVFELVHEQDLNAMRSEVRRATFRKQNFEIEFRIRHPLRGLRWLSSYGHAHFSSSGCFTGMSGIVLDITDRRQAQEELESRVRQRTHELTAANEEMQGFTYSVSHDLRAPLRAIVSTSHILLEEAAEKLDEEHRSLLERQALNANKLGELIDELLKMSRLSRQEMEITRLNLTSLAQEVATEVLENSGRADVHVSIQEDLWAHGDEKLVRFLIQNLIENSCKFSPEGGAIEIGSSPADTGNVYWVKDHGIGFEMKYSSKLFKPFERLVTDQEYPGTGIGLANVQRIAARHGGLVWAESEGPGKGATFYFTLGPYLS